MGDELAEVEMTTHGYGDAWICTLFRNEGEHLSSDLILEAIGATLHRWGPAPASGMLTFIDERKVRHKRDPGRCFRKAGFEPVGRTKERDLLVLQLDRAAMPVAVPPLGEQMELVS